VTSFIVVNNPKLWDFDIPEVQVISAKEYLINPSYTSLKGKVKIFNLSRSYRYQTLGYYVSLLAAARGHRVMPDILTIQDMKSQAVIRIISKELDEIIQKNLASLHSPQFILSVYFGKNVAKKYDRLAMELFNMFQAPFLRAFFEKDEKNQWRLININPIPASEIPEDHKPYVLDFAKKYFSDKSPLPHRKRNILPYDLAILVNPKEENPPSDAKALERFAREGEKAGFNVRFINSGDYSRLAEFDALFIRETTKVNHHTFRFSQRAAAEGLVVMDDPLSILRCTNKVYLAELIQRHNIPAPRTFILHQDNLEQIKQELGFPCVLKQPDSSFSQGVVKVDDETEFIRETKKLLNISDLIIAQEFLPTEFDWRVGILDREPLYVNKYFLARKHWQIMNWGAEEKNRYGKHESMVPEMAPRQLIRTALKAANLVGDGLYGVDLKQVGKNFFVIEINDNPSIESGVEDYLLKEKIYRTIMESFLRRVKEQKEGKK
jgi:glutathione synthase/RimK-type ligase-like ATP-grasp enzyme